MSQPDTLRETLGALLGELAWNGVEKARPEPQARARAPREPSAIAAAPFRALLSALGGKEAQGAPARRRGEQVGTPVATAAAPWAVLLERIASGGAPRAAPSNDTPPQWRSVAKKPPGETIGDFVESVEWT